MNWKFTLLIAISATVAGFFYHFNWFKWFKAFYQRKQMIKFAQKEVHSAQVIADPGKGKTLLLSIIARGITQGIVKTGFVSNIPHATLFSYSDINLLEPIAEEENYLIPKYFFVDEINSFIEGINFAKNRKHHEGVEMLFMWLRHFGIRAWTSGQRSYHVWVAVRDINNYYVKPRGIKPLFRFRNFNFFTLQVDFFDQELKLVKSFDILVSNSDFDLYDSYWLKDLRHFRPLQGKSLRPTELDKLVEQLKSMAADYEANPEKLAKKIKVKKKR